MITVHRILVPTDFSNHSVPAIRYAAGLAEKFGSELILLHIVQDLALVLPDAVMPVPVATPDIDGMMNSARKALAGLVDDLGIGKLGPKLEVRIGSPASEIVAAATDLKADLLCLSTHGRTGLAHLLLGSVAERIIRHAPPSCPVLVVRPEAQ